MVIFTYYIGVPEGIIQPMQASQTPSLEMPLLGLLELFFNQIVKNNL